MEVIGKISAMKLDGDNLTIVRFKGNGERKSKLTIRTSAISSIDYKSAGELAPGHIDVHTSASASGLAFERSSCAQFTWAEEPGFARIARALGVPGVDPDFIEQTIAERAEAKRLKADAAKSTWKKIGLGVLVFFALAIAIDIGHRLTDPEGYARARADRARSGGVGYGSNHVGADANPAPETKSANGEHCLSGWDGANRDLVRQVKASMRDPDSFEHVETRIYGNDNGEHGLWMTFRARNGFGGMNVEKVYARIDHDSCKALRFGDGPGL